MKLLSNYKTDIDIAAELGVHRRTIHRAVERGELVEARLASMRLIDIPASRAALAKRARKAKSAAK